MNLRFEPLDAWPQRPTRVRRDGTFRVKYDDLLAHFVKELDNLGAKSVTIAACVSRAEIRNDGHLRASARPSMPGIIVYFACRHGDLSFACDTFTDWRDNLRGIGLTLEYLRAVERYGATKGGEQYKGYLSLPDPNAPAAAPSVARGERDVLTPETPAAILLRLAGYEITLVARQAVERDAEYRETVWRAAVHRTHPDKGGSAADLQAVQTAYAALRNGPL